MSCAGNLDRFLCRKRVLAQHIGFSLTHSTGFLTRHVGASGCLRHSYAARLRRLFANPLGTGLRNVLCTTIGLQELLLGEACVPSRSGTDSRKRTLHRGRSKPHGAATSQTSFGHTVCHRPDTTVHHQASWTPPRVQELLLYGPVLCWHT